MSEDWMKRKRGEQVLSTYRYDSTKGSLHRTSTNMKDSLAASAVRSPSRANHAAYRNDDRGCGVALVAAASSYCPALLAIGVLPLPRNCTSWCLVAACNHTQRGCLCLQFGIDRRLASKSNHGVVVDHLCIC